ncbi:MAG: 3'-5' exonuclease, partial [Rikenellaceae bacterium]
MFKTKISKEELAALPNISFGGEVVVVDNYRQQSAAADFILQHTIVGFDTESRPIFQKGVRNSISLLQISAGDKVFLFRINKFNLSPKVVKILQSPNIKKIGAAVKDDIVELKAVGKFEAAGFIDLQSIVGEWGIVELSLQKISAIVLGRRLSKAQRLSNWSAVALTEAQITYAATDAWVCCLIYD